MTWPVVQLRRVARFAYGGGLDESARNYGDVPVFGSNGCVGEHDRANTACPVIVVGRKGSFGKVQYSRVPVFAIDTTYYVDRSQSAANLRWLYYALQTLGLDHVSSDTGVPGLSRERAYEQRLPFPPEVEQRAIADYLDTETARIDALIAKKRRLFELLEERQRSTRDRWFEAQVATWGTVALRRRVHRVEQGWSPVCDAVAALPDEWGVIKTSAVSSGTFLPTENKRLPDETEPELRWAIRDGDLLVTRGSGSRSMVAKACVARAAGRKLTISDLVYRVLLRGALSAYVAENMSASRNRAAIEASIRTDSGQTLKVRGSDLLDLVVAAAPAAVQDAEQTAIATALEELVKVGEHLQHQIELLVERRQALITAAVTGEMEVPA